MLLRLKRLGFSIIINVFYRNVPVKSCADGTQVSIQGLQNLVSFDPHMSHNKKSQLITFNIQRHPEKRAGILNFWINYTVHGLVRAVVAFGLGSTVLSVKCVLKYDTIPYSTLCGSMRTWGSGFESRSGHGYLWNVEIHYLNNFEWMSKKWWTVSYVCILQ